MKLNKYLKNYDLVSNIFGYWPSFHDGEISRFILDVFYNKEDEYKSNYIEFTIHCWEMTDKVNSKGYYVLKKHHLITFRFENVHDLELEGFNHQNVVLSLEFKVLKKNDRGFTPILIEIDPAYGLGGEFKAYSAEIIRVIPCDKNGNT